MRKLINFLVAMICIATMTSTVVHAEIAIPEATTEFYVNDFANVIPESIEAEMIERAKSLSDSYDGIQVVVTTVSSLQGNTIDDYADEMYNQYGIGKNDMGILILFAAEENEEIQTKIKVGKSMETYFNDSQAEGFIDAFARIYFENDGFEYGLDGLQENCIGHVITQIEKGPSDPRQSEEAVYKACMLIVLLFGFLLCLAFFLENYNVSKWRDREEEARRARVRRSLENEAREMKRRSEMYSSSHNRKPSTTNHSPY